jgi:hypothetical protein
MAQRKHIIIAGSRVKLMKGKRQRKRFDRYLDALEMPLKLKSVPQTPDEQSFVAVGSYLERNAGAGN